MRPLPAKFYQRRTEVVARELVGCVLQTPLFCARLVETEAYLPDNDAACHASRGATQRTLPMFESGGILYVYFIYGMHWCVNIVTDVKGRGAAVLLRSAIVSERNARNQVNEQSRVVSGPGRLSKHLGFDGTFTGTSVLRGSTICVFEDEHTSEYQRRVVATPRIGISVATSLLLRFVDVASVPVKSARGIQH